jgi:hypothetical protein
MFLFGTLDGTISGWSPANGNQAIDGWPRKAGRSRRI